MDERDYKAMNEELNGNFAKPMLGIVYLVSRYNDGEHPSSDVIKIFQNRIDAEQFVEEMKEKYKDNILFKYKHFYFEIDEMCVN